MSRRAILLLAYGTPRNLEEVEPYYTHIRGGRPPSPQALEDLRRRYASVGGRTRLTEITEETARALQQELGMPVYAGMRHWHPFIAETVARMNSHGVRHFCAIPLAPHESRISTGGYRDAVERAVEGTGMQFEFVSGWHRLPSFRALLAQRVREALAEFGESDGRVLTVFTAHSLPERIREWDDPYERQLQESSAAVADLCGIREWEFAFQSAGATDEPWLGPDIVDAIPGIASRGYRSVLVVPIGFVSDHLEILYDIDQEAERAARDSSLRLRRTRSLNADPQFIAVLAEIATGLLEPVSS
jgi:ferrochelatase